MTQISSAPASVFAPFGARALHGAWLGLAAAAGLACHLFFTPASPVMAVVWAAVLLPGVLGLVLADRAEASAGARLALALAWAAPGLAAAGMTGSVLSLALAVFFAGPLALAACGALKTAGLSAFANLIAAVVLVVFSLAGPGVAPGGAAEAGLALSAAAALHMAASAFALAIAFRSAAESSAAEAAAARDYVADYAAGASAPRDDAEIARLERERDEAVMASQSKSEFLAAMSHELRTPLNAIIGFSDLMKQRLFGPMPARYAEYADLIHESGVHLLDLIGDVLDMSKIEADRYELAVESFDARDVAETTAKLVRLRAEDRGLTLSTDLGDEPLEVEADRKALRQILLNLLSNAIKFTPEGGVVAVLARANGGELVIAVGDTGQGISAGEIERLGTPYLQTRSGQESDERGTGLGLSLVSALARMHGGSMQIESAPGEGTTVTIRMPVIRTGEVQPLTPAMGVREQIRMAQSAGETISRPDAEAQKASNS